MDAPPPPPSYPPPQRFPDQLIIREAENYAGESNRTSDAPHNQPLSGDPTKNELPRTSSIDSSLSQLFNFPREPKLTPNCTNSLDKKYSKNEIEKTNFVSKDQQIRSQQLEREKQKSLWSAPYTMSQRVPSTTTNITQISGDFHNVDWTPHDSAYGAAFPFCGWIPKRLREAVERILVGVALIVVVYTIVTVGMTLTNGLTRSSSSSSTVYTDDDFYVQDSYSQYDDTDDLVDDEHYYGGRIRRRQ